jgi:hypothetical protein
MKHPVAWQAPAPLWRKALEDAGSGRFNRPALLRFASDTFMEDLQRLLAEKPETLHGYVARKESWRSEAAGWLPAAGSNGQDSFEPDTAVKLFQPAHQRFYLVSASLICRIPGLPDRKVDVASEESVSFVLRRLVPKPGQAAVKPSDPATFNEYGWFGSLGWKPIPDPEKVDAKDTDDVLQEERRPMFQFPFSANGNGRRRILGGLLPVASRETYEAAPRAKVSEEEEDAISADPMADLRKTIFEANIGQLFLSLREEMGPAANKISAGEVRDVLAFALLDLAEFLDANVKSAWAAVLDPTLSVSDPDEEAVRLALQATLKPGKTWAQALRDVFTLRDEILENVTQNALVVSSADRASIRSAIFNLGFKAGISPTVTFLDRVFKVLDASPPPKPEDIPGMPAVVDASAGALYVVRCVYERPRCDPFEKPVVSPPSQVFQMASFFDLDAPIRPLRITMPIDTSMAGLRKAPKSLSILFSDQLRNQLSRLDAVRKLSEVEDGEIGEGGGFDIGMICSFSISIIFICAFVLLLVIMWMLNIVFWWSAFFKICLPIPLKK